MLDTDSSADVSQGQVVVEDLSAEGNNNDVPGDETAAEDQEPAEADRANAAPGLAADGLTPLR